MKCDMGNYIRYFDYLLPFVGVEFVVAILIGVWLVAVTTEICSD
jgi:hypothetical protein